MKISKAKSEDLSEIFDLITETIINLKSQGIFQWNDYYPQKEIFIRDLDNSSLYKLKKAKIKGIIAFDENQEDEYKKISWSHVSGKILVIHRLIVHPSSQRQGIGKKLMDFAENYAVENDYASIRLDAYSDNSDALRFYEKRNYEKVGEIMFPERELPFYCFEKQLR